MKKCTFKRDNIFLTDDFLIEFDCKVPQEWTLMVKGNDFEELRKGDIGYEDIYSNTLKYGWFNGMTIPQVLKVVGKEGYYYMSDKDPTEEFKEEERFNESLRQIMFTVILYQRYLGLADKNYYVSVDLVINELNNYLKIEGKIVKINFSSLYYLATTSKTIGFKFDKDLEKIRLEK